jgi:hypothetical protein
MDFFRCVFDDMDGAVDILAHEPATSLHDFASTEVGFMLL